MLLKRMVKILLGYTACTLEKLVFKDKQVGFEIKG